jgi:hypothetical protein
MNDRPDESPESPKDRLVARPEGQLPTPLDPAGPVAHGWPDDPKPDPADPADEEETTDLGRTT